MTFDYEAWNAKRKAERERLRQLVASEPGWKWIAMEIYCLECAGGPGLLEVLGVFDTLEEAQEKVEPVGSWGSRSFGPGVYSERGQTAREILPFREDS